MSEEINEEKKETKETKKDYATIIIVGLIAVLIIFIGFNALQLNQLTKINKATATGMVIAEPQGSQPTNIIDLIPKGIPNIYGKELGINFDDISTLNPTKADLTISKLGQLDESITLTGNNLQRYITIASQISCEYCCGAESIIFRNGQPACGCAHSFAMRGLAKYLIKNHPTEFTDNQILEELGKWKTLFFPGIMSQKAAILKEKGIELNYINLASNKYRGIENK